MNVVLRMLLYVPVAVGLCLTGSVTTFAQSHAQSQPQGARNAIVQPAEGLKIPNHQVWLGSVRIPRPVLADGKTLAAGHYRVRLTGEHVEKPIPGQTADLERWVEFVQSGAVKGRVLVPVVPAASVSEVAEQRPPRPGHVKVQMLKPEDHYLRLWFNYRGDQVLTYLPLA